MHCRLITLKPGQSVNFSVDSFPERQFRGEVQQVRLSATNTANVITYPVVVAVANADQTLLHDRQCRDRGQPAR